MLRYYPSAFSVLGKFPAEYIPIVLLRLQYLCINICNINFHELTCANADNIKALLQKAGSCSWASGIPLITMLSPLPSPLSLSR